MDARQCNCAACYFGRNGKTKTKWTHKAGWMFKDVLQCNLNPPSARAGGDRPQIEPDGVCVRFTTADLSQPLAHLNPNPYAVTVDAAQDAGNEKEVE